MLSDGATARTVKRVINEARGIDYGNAKQIIRLSDGRKLYARKTEQLR